MNEGDITTIVALTASQSLVISVVELMSSECWFTEKLVVSVSRWFLVKYSPRGFFSWREENSVLVWVEILLFPLERVSLISSQFCQVSLFFCHCRIWFSSRIFHFCNFVIRCSRSNSSVVCFVRVIGGAFENGKRWIGPDATQEADDVRWRTNVITHQMTLRDDKQ